SSKSERRDTSILVHTAALPISLATCSAPLALMSATTIFAPSSAKRLAIPAPNPDAAPVMTATLSLRRFIRFLPPGPTFGHQPAGGNRMTCAADALQPHRYARAEAMAYQSPAWSHS